MNKILKISLSLIVIGAILLAVATYLNKGSIPLYSETYEQKSYKVAAKDINTITADLRISDVVIEDNNSSSDIEIEYYTSRYQDFNIHTTNDTLNIREDEKARGSFFNFGFNSPKYTQTVIIKISPLVAKKLSIHTKAGDITAKNIRMTETILENESGDIILENLTSTKELTVNAKYGNVKINDIKTEGNNNYFIVRNSLGDTSANNIADFDILNISNPRGSVDVTSSTPKNLSLYSENDDIKVDSVLNGDTIYVQTVRGDINLTNVDVTKDMYFISNAGDINVSVADSEDNYAVNTTNPPASKKHLSTITNSGDVNIKFTK